jgi:hypothetical protein
MRAYDLETPEESAAKASSRQDRLEARRRERLARAEALLVQWNRKLKRAKTAIRKLTKQAKYLKQHIQ